MPVYEFTAKTNLGPVKFLKFLESFPYSGASVILQEDGSVTATITAPSKPDPSKAASLSQVGSVSTKAGK